MNEVEVKSEATNLSHWLDREGNPLPCRVSSRSRAWRPPTDVYETEEDIIVRVEIAGMQEAEFSVLLEDTQVSIQGKRQDDNSERRAYHQMEIRFGEFCSQLELSWPIDSKNVEADYQDGFLWVRLPKARSHQIRIRE